MSILDPIKKRLDKALQSGKVFMFDGEYLQAIAFMQGTKDDNIQAVKHLARKHGFVYDYDYDCYLKECHLEKHLNRPQNGEYREERDAFIERIVSWKLSNV